MKRGSEDWASLTPFLRVMPACELILFLMGPLELSFSQNLSGQMGIDLPAKGRKKRNSPSICRNPQTLCNLTPPWFSEDSFPISLHPAFVRSSTFMSSTCEVPLASSITLTLGSTELQCLRLVTECKQDVLFLSCKTLADK